MCGGREKPDQVTKGHIHLHLCIWMLWLALYTSFDIHILEFLSILLRSLVNGCPKIDALVP